MKKEKLTRAASHALIRLGSDWRSAKELEVSIQTLEALRRLDIVDHKMTQAHRKPEANLYRLKDECT